MSMDDGDRLSILDMTLPIFQSYLKGQVVVKLHFTCSQYDTGGNPRGRGGRVQGGDEHSELRAAWAGRSVGRAHDAAGVGIV